MPDPNDLSGNQLSFSRFAFNIYGTLNQTSLEANSSASPTPSMIPKLHNTVKNSNFNKLVYNCEREVSSISQLDYSLNGLVKNYDENPLHHLIIGGKNYLKLLAMNYDQTKIIHEVDILELSKSIYSSNRSNKLTNVSTIESQNDTIACELATGLISVYKVQNNGKCKLIRKYTDHKRCVNSLDFINQSNNMNTSLPFQLISGSQDGTIKLWDLRAASNKPTITISSNAHSDPVRSCQYSPHSTARNRITILSVHDSGALCKYDLRSPNGGYQHNISMPERKWNFHTGPALSLNIHPEKEYVITGGRDQKVCVWNYGDSITNQNKMTPEYVVNTYGPVMKIRWSTYSNNISTNSEGSNNFLQLSDSKKYDDKTTSIERENNVAMLSAANSNPLFNYDFACLFLNDDPTISIYNLSRKYIPKEVISSNSNKPFQNFIWAKNLEKSRRIWTITKANQFTAYDLQGPRSDNNITKPLENLSNVSMSWCSGLGDLCFVNQDKGEFENISQLDYDSFRSESEEYEMESGLPLDGSGLGSTSFMGEHPTDDRSLKYRVSSNSLDNSSIYHSKHTIASIPIASNPSTTPLSYQNPSIPNSLSPTFDQISKPLLQRASTHNAITQHPKIMSSKLQSRNNMGIEALMEYGTNTTSGNASPSGYLRPPLNRNHSQSTQGSNIPNSSMMPYQTLPPPLKRTMSINYPSPYVIPLSIPLPQNNEETFETLSNNYLISSNDGFSLIDICLFNANVSAAVNNFRDCQTWRVLAVSLEEDEYYLLNYKESISLKNEKLEDNIRDKLNTLDGDNRKSYNDTQVNQNIDNRSILSELDNFVGSYNSNSTLTSNYGGLQSERDRDSIASQREVNKSSKMNIHKEIETFDFSKDETTEKTDKIVENNKSADEIGDTESRDRMDPLHSNLDEGSSKIRRNSSGLRKYPSMPTIDSNNGDNKSMHCSTSSSSPININPLDNYERNQQRGVQANLNKLNSVGKYGSLKNRKLSFGPENLRRSSRNSPGYNYTNSWDLDDENSNLKSNNMQFVTNNSLSSYGISPYQSRVNSPTYFEQLHHSYNSTNLSPRPYYNSVTPGSSRKNSYISPVHGFQNKTSYKKQSPMKNNDAKNEQYATELSDVKEQAREQSPIDDVTKNSIIHAQSKLTKAITDGNNESSGIFRPWKTENLLKEILVYASQQGDVLLCSTLTILFYDYLNARNSINCITRSQGLAWLSLYIEVLQRKQLFSNAMYVVNMAPKDLQSELSSLTNAEVNLRFYCCWCQKLLVNEKSKSKVPNDNFGYWYCDECSTKLLNCIYCNEPCKGLNIVTSLSCGHRGHFGCLREWFVDEENIECPGGCDEPIIT